MPTGNPTITWSDHGYNTLEGRCGVLVDNDFSLARVRFGIKKDTVAAALLDELLMGLDDVAPQTRAQVLCAFGNDHRPRRRVGLQRLWFVCHVFWWSLTLVQSLEKNHAFFFSSTRMIWF